MRRVRQIAPVLSIQFCRGATGRRDPKWRYPAILQLSAATASRYSDLTMGSEGVIVATPSPGVPMTKPDPKNAALRAQGALHPRRDEVADELFDESDFFDARDLVQVKYEMLRRVRVEGRSVTRAATDFGFSRPSFYQAKDAFERGGIPGLVPKRRGPKAAHKLTGEVVDYLEQVLKEEPSLKALSLTARITKRFGIHVHPRSVERALARRRESRRRKRGLQ